MIIHVLHLKLQHLKLQHLEHLKLQHLLHIGQNLPTLTSV